MEWCGYELQISGVLAFVLGLLSGAILARRCLWPGGTMKFENSKLIPGLGQGNLVHAKVGSRVRLSHCPGWISKKIQAGYPKGTFLPGATGTEMLYSLKRDWLDHWGSTVLGGKTVLVSEPYGLAQKDLAELTAFTERCGLSYSITARSEWYPTMTLRIIIQ